MMLSLLDARLWAAAIIIAFVFGFGGCVKGRHDESVSQKLEIAKANDRAREVERMASLSTINITSQYIKERNNARSKIDSLRADVRDGRVRLSFRSAVPSTTNSAAIPGAGAEERTELLSSDADALISIAGECDATVRQLNAVIEVYEATRNGINRE